ncbi:hypothetical protein [Streptomyces polyrhachis]|uniref:hypothetical protein n=1 Tax=Streptomyces polyrhachis TaxID=1282885 RepID=UPI0036DDA7FC
MPSVVLHPSPTQVRPAGLDPLARVEVADEHRMDAVSFLAALDPVEMERAALARNDLESVPAGVTAAVLRQLVEWARGD